MIVIEVIQIKWEGPFFIEDLKSLNNDKIDYGIYQIYGNHLVYGENVLLYIGQANEQTFFTRIRQHYYWLEDDFSFYIGRLSGQDTPSYEIWHNKISAAEQLLIHIHAPSYNTANINSVNADIVGHIHIFNIGKYKSLLPEVSGRRWLKEIEMLSDNVYRYNE
ncbi:hypothetical protein [Globicatella sulfidifaciens]|uniref:hypothetical protein n=1 Tax=Globicatella sulfidifaciens TaxID=136093 RepID=UPI0023F4D041|nr:hypothetical protein [Globicatella sulfidifaciens]